MFEWAHLSQMLEGGTFQDFAKLNFWVCQKKGRNHDICLLCDKSAYCINKMCPLTEQCAPYHGSRGMKIPQPGLGSSGGPQRDLGKSNDALMMH